MLKETDWAKALQNAIDEYLQKKTGGAAAAIPAAPLKPLLVRHAGLLGLTFPPDGFERVKFVDFLNQFPDVVQTHRRAGQDTLVVKVGDAQLLENIVKSEIDSHNTIRPPKSLRQDVFDAFTRIPVPTSSYWYAPEQDKFVLVEGGKHDWVEVPPLLTETAFHDRRAFSETQVSTSLKSALLLSLNENASPLRAFSVEVKKHRLGRAWHIFHLKCIMQRISQWSSSNGISWKNTWECSGEPTPQHSNVVTAQETNSFLAGLMRLDPEEKKRVMVPLDIVLRLIRRD